MLSSEAEWVFMGFVFYISGIQGRANTICALKGFAVNLTCSAKHLSSSMKWYTVNRTDQSFLLNELTADENEVKYNMTDESNFTLTINNVSESDEKFYCCRKTTDNQTDCWGNRTQLQVADLQVKVIPSTEGQTVTLMCSTSCPLTEKPAAYIWYKNGEFLYEDWSPWYQELLSSDQAVRYSCAVKGYEGLRAPEVSVDSVSPVCFSVTYAKGKMCSYRGKSMDEPCSIIYPRDTYIQRTPQGKSYQMKCMTSCPITDPHTAYRWYWNKELYSDCESSSLALVSESSEIFSCAVKGNEELRSRELCVGDLFCFNVNYDRRRICALEGTAVHISSQYLHPENFRQLSKSWYKIKRRCEEKEDDAVLVTAAGPVNYLDNSNNQHTLRIDGLKMNDTAEYIFKLIRYAEYEKCEPSDLPGVLLAVTGLTVTMSPSAEVTEGQRVTLTCSTSCPLTDNNNYIWYLNSRPLSQNKHLVLDPVGLQHAGNYSCAVKTHGDMESAERALTVQARDKTMAVMNALKAAILLLILLAAFLFYLRMRKKKTVTTEPSGKVQAGKGGQMSENIALMDMNPAAQREPAEQQEDKV
ncbi:uncharacterized protein LOC111570905 [Amphiprion ocellaris]|uniref:Ig-like domain-containing protein n=1 Tax=Amphiprion ocellaris TaxID=80972 RepID=A0AAQ5X5Q1_AMPOC|nr:uncharacterized protein LOC111570905 [Amphiprion ocellaris]XP_035805706.2 uncharacterized protein LOC111570905 [Amphiprion ocellaris]